MFTLPRVGHEVVVQFLDGDPDRPLVTGSVYNNENMVAWKLPDHSTLSGIKTQSSEEGSNDTANELRFEDKKDKEYIWFHAQKDFFRTIVHDAFDYVGNNETIKVELTRKEVIGENWFMDITKDVMHNMGKDLHVKVAGDIFYTGRRRTSSSSSKDLNAKVGGDLGLTSAARRSSSRRPTSLSNRRRQASLKAAGDLMPRHDDQDQGCDDRRARGRRLDVPEGGGSDRHLSGRPVSTSTGRWSRSTPAAPAFGSRLGPFGEPDGTDRSEERRLHRSAEKDDYEKNFDDPMPEGFVTGEPS